MLVQSGATDVTTYVVLRDSATKAPKTDVAVADIDLYYVEEKAAMSAKVDAAALDAATSDHADNKAFHVGLGLYRVDWPDAAFDGAAGKRAWLIVVAPGADTEFIEVELSVRVSANVISVDEQARTQMFGSEITSDYSDWESSSFGKKIVAATLEELVSNHASVAGSVAQWLHGIKAALANLATNDGDEQIIYDDDDVTVLGTMTITEESGVTTRSRAF